MSLERALEKLELEVASLGLPIVSSTDWFILRAKSTALSMLRAAQRDRLAAPPDFESFRRKCRERFVQELGPETARELELAGLQEPSDGEEIPLEAAPVVEPSA